MRRFLEDHSPPAHGGFASQLSALLRAHGFSPSASEAQNGAEINLMEQAVWRAWEGLKEAVGCSGTWILSLVAWV